MNTYTVKLVAHAGTDPLTGIYGKAGEETLTIEANDERQASNKVFAFTTLPLMGQIVDVYINGALYLDPTL